MSRYTTKAAKRPKAEGWDYSQTIIHPAALVEPPVDTGLLDQDGRKIYRCPDEIGFLPRREGRL